MSEWVQVAYEDLEQDEEIRVTFVGTVIGYGVCVDNTVKEIPPTAVIERRVPQPSEAALSLAIDLCSWIPPHERDEAALIIDRHWAER